MRRKKLKYNSDYMSEKMDKALEQIEDKLSALYANAAYDINQKFSDFMEEHEKKDALYQERVFNGEMTEADFIAWRNREIVRTDRFKATVDEMSSMMVSTDQAAMALVNGAMPSVVAQSYNFTQALGWESANKSGLTQGTFQIYNARSVQKLIKDNPDILHQVDDGKDKTWNYNHINREITQGMIQGEPIQKIADRLQRVTSMDENAAVRNARTAMTAAENMGRAEAADDLKAQGIPMDEVWSATYDDRTRETHLELDGTVRDENGLFGVGIINKPLRFPADPEGDPEEIYNCRCRLSLQLKGIDHSNDKELYEEFMASQFPESWEKVQNQMVEKEDVYPQENKQNPKDYVAEKGADTSSDMKVRAEEVNQMSRDELKREFVDSDSYIYDPKYTSMESERMALMKEANDLKEERHKLTDELKGEQKAKPKSQWDDNDEIMALLGDKPMIYTERGEEIVDRLEQIRGKESPIESKAIEIRDEINMIDRKNAREQIEEWDSKDHPFEKGDINKEYEGFSTKIGIVEFDKDLAEGKGFIAEMSPDEYIDRIAYDIFENSRENTVDVWYDNIKEYASMMASGIKFDMGYIDYLNGGQEGRHRAMAAKLLGIEKIPVYIRGRRP